MIFHRPRSSMHGHGPASNRPGKVHRADFFPGACKCWEHREWTRVYSSRPWPGVLCVIIIFATVTTVRHLSQRSNSTSLPLHDSVASATAVTGSHR
jgi:hypothetical protein